MSHTDVFVLLTNIIFSNGFVTFLLLSIGLYRFVDGINRVKFENRMDERANLIPDESVYYFWLRISKLNLHFGRFFIGYGFLFMSLGLINLMLPHEQSFSAPVITKNGFILFVLWVIGFLIVRNNGWQSGEAYGLRYMRQKNRFFEYYKFQDFKPIKEWDLVKLHSITHAPEIALITIKDVTASNFEQKLTPWGFYLYYLTSLLMALIYVF